MPVPFEYKSGDDNVFPVMGILGTPVIDRSAGAMYIVADTFEGGVDVFRLHAIALSNGQELVSPVQITFSASLADGSMWTFDLKYQIQRAGLLEANGSIYVTFASNGDINPDISRGTILRFDAHTLQLLGGEITDKLHEHRKTPPPFYLSTIWQSGYAPTADGEGKVFFTTGNSDPVRPTYNQSFNRPDSVVKLSGDLSALLDSFTPHDYFQLDQVDSDLGSGGTLLLPDQPGPIPHLAVAGGKDGRAFLMNRDDLGGYNPSGPDKVLQVVTMGACWCGPAISSDRTGRHASLPVGGMA
jgi:hypothetical protein